MLNGNLDIGISKVEVSMIRHVNGRKYICKVNASDEENGVVYYAYVLFLVTGDTTKLPILSKVSTSFSFKELQYFIENALDRLAEQKSS